MKEVLMYGEIGYEVTALGISEEIRDEEEILVRINSYGGDVFEAQAIYNLLQPKQVEVKIDGICASAATLIACAGKKVSMPANGLYMIHLPSTMLSGYYNRIDLEKTKTRLDKITETILGVYESKTKQEKDKLREMLEEETWMTAEEGKRQGFIDEVLGTDPEVADRINRVKMKVDAEKEGRKMESEQSLYEKFKSWLRKEEVDKEAVERERRRIEELDGVTTQSVAQKAIINLAKKDGRTLTQIQGELDAIGQAELAMDQAKKAESEKQLEYLYARLRDYVKSNVESVKSVEKAQPKDSVEQVVSYAKELIK